MRRGSPLPVRGNICERRTRSTRNRPLYLSPSELRPTSSRSARDFAKFSPCCHRDKSEPDSDSGLWVRRYPESVVCILELWRNAGAGSATSDFDVVTPGTSARSAALAAVGTSRIALNRGHVIIVPIPITAPFMHILADVVESERIGQGPPDRFGTSLPALAIVGQ